MKQNKQSKKNFRIYPLIQPLYWSDQVCMDFDQAISVVIKDKLSIDPSHVLPLRYAHG